MPQFTVYQNKNLQTKKAVPYLLDVQASFLSELQTCVVVPLYLASTQKAQAMTKLTPILHIAGSDYILQTPQLAGIMRRDLGKPVADLSAARFEIIAALDVLLTGF